MLLSRKLLNKINPKFSNLTNEELQIGLNAIGIEVEQILDNSKLSPKLELVKIINIENHPDSDHLHICTIDNNGKEAKIVCGAKNLQTNVFALLAPIGYELPNSIVIQERKIRGVISQGMLCGYSELNPNVTNSLSKFEQDSIIMAPLDSELNSNNILDFFGLNDTIFELSLPSNRNELNGIYFIAYELNAYFNFDTKLIIPNETINFTNKIKITSTTKSLNSYGLLEFECEKHNFNLDWSIKKYLINSGIHPTNTLADIGNFVTLLFATPTHMFDANKVNNLCIKEINNEITINALDNKDYLLDKSTIVVETNDEIIAAIGLIGSKKFAINENTTHVYMEFANLNNADFIKYAKRSSINSNSKNLFLKSISTNVNLLAMFVCLKYILPSFQFIHNISCVKTFDFYQPSSIQFDINEINQTLGINLEEQKINEILSRTGNCIQNNEIVIPFYRQDLTNIYDIAEEIIKTIDINKFSSTPISAEIINFNSNKEYQFNKKIKDYFVNLGFIETKTYNLTSESNVDKFNLYGIKDKIAIKNPSSNERKFLRHNLVNQMIEVLAYNLNHKQDIENIFEVQKIQFDFKKAQHIFNAILSTSIAKNIITKDEITNNIYTAYNIFHNLIQILNLKNINVVNHVFNISELDENGFAIKSQDKIIGYIGKINNKYLKNEFKINNNNLFIINFNLDELFLLINKDINKINPISEFNPIYKEITFENPNNHNISDIVNKLYFNNNIETIKLFDFYNNENKNSYTISIKIQSYEKTLDQDEISKIFNKCLEILESNGLSIRK